MQRNTVSEMGKKIHTLMVLGFCIFVDKKNVTQNNNNKKNYQNK